MKHDEQEDDGIISVDALPRTIVEPLPLSPQPQPLLERHSVGQLVRLSVDNTVDLSVDTSARESASPTVGSSMGKLVGHSVGDSVRLSMDNSVEESVGHSVRDSVGQSAELPAETSISTNSLSPSNDIDQSFSARRNLRDQLQARLAGERELLAKRNEDAANIAAQCIPDAGLIFNDDWKNEDVTYTTPTKPAPSSNRPMSPVADRVLHFPQVADRVLHRTPVTERVIPFPSFPIFEDNDPRSPHQLQLRADRKRRQKTQKERWMAANEEKRSELIISAFKIGLGFGLRFVRILV
jgi:hypothetical protein